MVRLCKCRYKLKNIDTCNRESLVCYKCKTFFTNLLLSELWICFYNNHESVKNKITYRKPENMTIKDMFNDLSEVNAYKAVIIIKQHPILINLLGKDIITKSIQNDINNIYHINMLRNRSCNENDYLNGDNNYLLEFLEDKDEMIKVIDNNWRAYNLLSNNVKIAYIEKKMTIFKKTILRGCCEKNNKLNLLNGQSGLYKKTIWEFYGISSEKRNKLKKKWKL